MESKEKTNLYNFKFPYLDKTGCNFSKSCSGCLNNDGKEFLEGNLFSCGLHNFMARSRYDFWKFLEKTVMADIETGYTKKLDDDLNILRLHYIISCGIELNNKNGKGGKNNIEIMEEQHICSLKACGLSEEKIGLIVKRSSRSVNRVCRKNKELIIKFKS